MLINNAELYAAVREKATLVYNVVRDTDTELVVNFTGFVGDEDAGNDPSSFNRILAGAKGKRVRVQINSGGGLVNAGTHIYDLLSQYEGEVVTEIYGMTASAATIIAQAGYRRMSKNAQMLIHHGWGVTIGNVFTHQKTIDTLNAVDAIIYGIYEQKSPGKAKEIKDLMAAHSGDGKWITAEQALEYGLIDEVFTPAKAAAPDMVLNSEESSNEEMADAQSSDRIAYKIKVKQRKEV